MDNALNALLSWQFILFSLGISAIVWTFRTIMEYIFPKIVSKDLWEKLILPILPLGLGLVIAKFAVHYSYPDGLSSLSGREFFGAVAGMFSGLTYQVVKGMLKNKIQSYAYPYQYPVYPSAPAAPTPSLPAAATITTTPPTPLMSSFPQSQQSTPSYDPAMEETVSGVGGKQP